MRSISKAFVMERTFSDYDRSSGSIQAGSLLDDGLDNVLMMDPEKTSEAVADRQMPGP